MTLCSKASLTQATSTPAEAETDILAIAFHPLGLVDRARGFGAVGLAIPALTCFMHPAHNVAMKCRDTPTVAQRLAKPSDSLSIPFRDIVGWAMIFCATLAAYLPALHGDLLWDDSFYLTKPELQPVYGLWRIWSEVGATPQYYPLLYSAFWLEHRIWGDAVAGYHLLNIALHAISACLVVMIVRRLSLPGAWLAGFVFALHPVCVEGVAWISEQKSTLSGVFCLASLLACLRFDQTRRKSEYLLATGLFVLALLSKSVTATLPAVLLVIFWWQRGRLAWRRDLVPLLPWFALGISAGLFTAWMERTVVGAQGAAFMLSPAQHVLLAGRAICFYAAKLLWPANLAFSYARWKIDPAAWWQWLFPAAVLALATGLIIAARRYRGPLAGFLIFAGTLFPVLGFLHVYPFRYSWVADHFQYLAILGIIIPLTAVLTGIAGRTSPAVSVVLVLFLGVLTWRQSGAYRDVETLYRETLVRNPDSWLAHNNLGVVLSEMPGMLDDAIGEYQAALRIEPDYPETHYNLGNALSQTPHMLPDAIAEYQTALRIKPDYPEAHYNLGNALARIPDRLPDAVAEYRTVLRTTPDLASAHYNLGLTLAKMPDRLPDAIAEYRTALRFRPDHANTHLNLGIALAQIPGRLPDAIAEYRAALRIQPDLVEAHDRLGSALSQIPGRLPDAFAEYQAALRIRPGYKPTLQSIERLRAARK